jgi:ribonucleoside-diphosphate reductase beta chain
MIFDKRKEYKPFEYPGVQTYIDAMNNSYWVHTEVNFTADVQDYHTKLAPHEQQAVKRALLAISQIEINVKQFWGDLYKHIPKPEFNNLGATNSESEIRHGEAYSRLLEVLGFNDEFKKLIEVPIINDRIEYLNHVMSYGKSLDENNKSKKEQYVLSLILFSILIENVSLFSQFAIILSFTRFSGLLKNVSNIIGWTSIDEQIHAQSGIFIINQIRAEYPEMFTIGFKLNVEYIVEHSIKVESKMLDWIFEAGEFESVSKEDLLNFMKKRVDDSLKAIGMDALYNVDENKLESMVWFEEETTANTLDDFFAKRPVDYTKAQTKITSDDLF